MSHGSERRADFQLKRSKFRIGVTIAHI